MKGNFFHSLVYVLIITFIISGTAPVMVAADEGIPSEGDGNSTTLLPDLIINDLSWSPANPETGEQVTITATVKNQGDAASGSTNIVFYSNGNNIGQSSVPELEAGNSEKVDISWSSETEDTVEISAKVDEANSVEEKDENNNVIISGSITFKKTKLPDLIINSLEHSAYPTPGDFQRIYISIKNQGSEASQETKLLLYIEGAPVSDWNVPRLSQGESSYFSYDRITLPGDSVEIKAVVDKDNLIRESDEENNEKTITMTVAREFLPDLIIEDLVPESTEAEKGKTLNLTLKVKNQGTASSEEVLAEYYINGTVQPDKIRIPALSERTGSNITFSLTPDREGQMEVKVIIPSGTFVPESNEENNVFTKIINVKVIRPDLVIESLFLNPEVPKINDNITFTVSIKNKGLKDSASSELNYYINGTNVTHSGKVSVPAINIGETTKGTFYWTPEEEGSLIMHLVADAGNAILEDDETNNKLIKTVSISKQTTSSSGGGSGSTSSSTSSSSMGSGVSKEPARNVEVKELATRNIISGYHIKYDFAKNVTCVTYIEFDSTKTFKKTTATVEVSRKNPLSFKITLLGGYISK